MLDPLIILDLAAQLDGVGVHAEEVVGKLLVGGGQAGGVDHLAVEVGMQLVDVAQFGADTLRFLEHAGGLDRTALIPEKQGDARDDHDESQSHSSEAVLQPGSIGGGRYFLVSHFCKYLGIS